MRVGKLTLTAIVVVNALGDIFNPKTGEKIAGFHKPDRSGFADSITAALHNMLPKDPFTGNTTIGAIITNAEFSKAEMGKIASMTRNAYARCINPVGTMADGDTIYAASFQYDYKYKIMRYFPDMTIFNKGLAPSNGVATIPVGDCISR